MRIESWRLLQLKTRASFRVRIWIWCTWVSSWQGYALLITGWPFKSARPQLGFFGPHARGP